MIHSSKTHFLDLLQYSCGLWVAVPPTVYSSGHPSQIPADLGNSYPYINHSLISQATRYIGSIDFSPPTARCTDCKETLCNGHKQEVEKQTTGVFRLTTMADSEALVTAPSERNQFFTAHGVCEHATTTCELQKQ